MAWTWYEFFSYVELGGVPISEERVVSEKMVKQLLEEANKTVNLLSTTSDILRRTKLELYNLKTSLIVAAKRGMTVDEFLKRYFPELLEK